MTLLNFLSFVGPNIISNGSTDKLSIRQFDTELVVNFLFLKYAVIFSGLFGSPILNSKNSSPNMK